MLSVSVDVACVRAHAGPLFGGLDEDGGVVTMMPHTREYRAKPCPCLLGWRTPFELWTPVTPPAAVLQRTSSAEQLLRMYNGNGLHLLLSLLRQLQWTLNTLHHYTLPGLSYVEDRPVGDWALLNDLQRLKALRFLCCFEFCKHAKPPKRCGKEENGVKNMPKKPVVA